MGMLADYGLMAAGMVQMGEPLGWVYVVVMWVTVGNGMRYGNHYLYVAGGDGDGELRTHHVLLTRLLAVQSEFPPGHRPARLGLAAVPLYFSTPAAAS